MPMSKDELLAKLKDAGIQFDMFEHPPVMTVEAQINALPGNPQTVLKNLFVKDKKHRCYIISALPDTKIDMQVLSARLGTGKGGVRLAPEELLQQVLQVPLGSVTPLAVANPEAADVVLLLDRRIRDPAVVPPEGGQVFVHPLVNTTSLGLSSTALEAAIRCLGREPLFVDLEIEPKIDRENPPDLKAIADAAKPPPQALPEAAAAAAAGPAAVAAAGGAGGKPAAPAAAATVKPAAAAAKANTNKKSAGASQKSAAGAAKAATTTSSLADVAPRVDELLAVACTTLLRGGASNPEAAVAGGLVDSYGMAWLRSELEMQLTSLKNAAYAAGYVAGKGEVVAHAERRYV